MTTGWDLARVQAKFERQPHIGSFQCLVVPKAILSDGVSSLIRPNRTRNVTNPAHDITSRRYHHVAIPDTVAFKLPWIFSFDSNGRPVAASCRSRGGIVAGRLRMVEQCKGYRDSRTIELGMLTICSRKPVRNRHTIAIMTERKYE